MSYPQTSTGQPLHVPVEDRYWIGGANSLCYPTDIQQGGYYWGENLVNRGGIVQTRPGRKLLFLLPGTTAQGITLYRPYRQKEQLVWSIDGNVFWSEYPFTTYSQVPAISFYKYSPQVYFCQSRKAVDLAPDGTLVFLPTPVDMLLIQDGYTPSAFYIGSTASGPLQSGHNQGGPPFYQCPVGQLMCFSGYRLWVAYLETIFASDLLNPNSFTEGTYLAEADGFKLPEACTGMLQTPGDPSNNVAPGLLAFSPFSITSLQSGVLDRTQWQNTPNFQAIISSDYGSVAPFGPVNQFGMPWFFSEVGLVNLNEALQQYRSSTVNPRDGEMTRSKMNMSPLRSGVCGVAFENWLLYSVPSGSRFNRHTWVMDGSPQAQLSSQAGPCFAGIWTGTFPVQYATGEVQDVPRCFELSYSCNPLAMPNGQLSHIAIWEDFIGRRTDYLDTPISCSWETKIFEVSQIGELMRFKYAEIDIVELIGEVSLQIYYAGIKGHYQLCYEMTLNAEEGVPGSPNFPLWTYSGLATDTLIQTLKPQSRTVRTPEFTGSKAESEACADTCEVESAYIQNVDKGFQLLFNWQGRMGIRELRLFVDTYPQPGIGNCTPTETGEVNILSAIGCLPPPQVCLIPVP
jgi:hypothetical protein